MVKGEENLIPLNERSKEEAKAIQYAGGVARGKQRTAEKTFKHFLQIALAQTIKNGQGEEKEIKEAIMLKVIQRALKGDQKAIEYITKMIGEDVGQTITINQPLNVDINQIKKINEEIDKK